MSSTNSVMFKTLALVAFAFVAASPAAATSPSAQEWLNCASNCPTSGPNEVPCIDECTDDYNDHNANHMVPLGIVGDVGTCDPGTAGGSTEPVNGRIMAAQCAAGTTLTSFDLPQYDASGAIIDYETIAFCLEDQATATR